MIDLLGRLGRNAQRGSKPRCHLLTHGDREIVAARLTELAEPFARVAATDLWMPRGFEDVTEAELDKAPLVPAQVRDTLAGWWLGSTGSGAKTPNFDIASTCAIEGRPGLLLVEGKAHETELASEAKGRQLRPEDSNDRRRSHETIGNAIAEAREGLERDTGLPWGIGRDSHYQMSNRFAWAWKLTDLGVPVVLVYLGFLRANEMTDKGPPFTDHQDWERVVKDHSQPLFPDKIWDQRWLVNGVPLIPLIRSLAVPLESGASMGMQP